MTEKGESAETRGAGRAQRRSGLAECVRRWLGGVWLCERGHVARTRALAVIKYSGVPLEPTPQPSAPTTHRVVFARTR